MSEQWQILLPAIAAVCNIAIAILGYFFFQKFAADDETKRQSSKTAVDLAVFTATINSNLSHISGQLDELKVDVKVAVSAAQQLHSLQKAIAILERNEKTIFARIDEVRELARHGSAREA